MQLRNHYPLLTIALLSMLLLSLLVFPIRVQGVESVTEKFLNNVVQLTVAAEFDFVLIREK